MIIEQVAGLLHGLAPRFEAPPNGNNLLPNISITTHSVALGGEYSEQPSYVCTHILGVESQRHTPPAAQWRGMGLVACTNGTWLDPCEISGGVGHADRR